MSEARKCKSCTYQFQIQPEDFTFYETVKVPPPTLCPDCRQQRRMAWRNERTLYRRQCDKTGKDIISFYAPNAPVVVYDQNIWWGDSWDPMECGRDFDFSRPFFDQFAELLHVAPHFSLHNVNPSNSEFANLAGYNKNCYMCFSSIHTEDCMYCAFIDASRDCIDCIYTNDQSELCYYAVDCSRCYRCCYIQNCTGLSDSYFCYNCSNCDHCFGCVNARNASYLWFGEKISPEEYEKKLKEFNTGSFASIQKMKHDFTEYCRKFPIKYATINNCQDSSGNYLSQTKNCKQCFDSFRMEDCAYIIRSYDIKDCYDSHGIPGPGELMYEALSSGYSNNTRFSIMCNFDSDVQYCDQCCNCQNLFGCVGLKKKQNCILNKQYTNTEYDSLVEKIVNHMKETGEYGEFFPASLSPFGYNETVASEMYPFTREEALAKGYHWQDELQMTKGKETLSADQLPDDIIDIPDAILQEILACTSCQKNYKIIKQELAFYKKLSIPLPRQCWDCRYKEHTQSRPPRKLWQRKCMNEGCMNEFETTYAPDRPEIIYCESCYQREVV